MSGCSFCTRRRTGTVRSVTPEQAYNHLKFLKEQGAEQVNINDDTFFASPGLLQGLAEQFETFLSTGSPLFNSTDLRVKIV